MIGEFFIIKGKLVGYLKSFLKGKNDRVLDLGCGENPYYHKYIEGDIVCLDIIKTDTVNVVSDADNLPFKANSFDKVISINSFYYLKNPFNVVKELNKVLKKHGKLILILPFFYPIHDAPLDKYRFTEHGIKTLLKDHFEIDKMKAIGGFFNLPAIVLHSFIKGLPLIAPKSIRFPVRVLAYILYPLYIVAQLISILDVFDKTDRFPTYYLVVAVKK